MARTLPNPDLFAAMYVRREAVLSSQIEGTQSTLEDVLSYELDPRQRDVPQDVEEVVNYVRAMNYGLERLATLPLSLRFIHEIHAELLGGVRGADNLPGEFRRSQNWIGPGGATLSQATFVPPPVPEMTEARSKRRSPPVASPFAAARLAWSSAAPRAWPILPSAARRGRRGPRGDGAPFGHRAGPRRATPPPGAHPLRWRG